MKGKSTAFKNVIKHLKTNALHEYRWQVKN
jgi:hypothetical protein